MNPSRSAFRNLRFRANEMEEDFQPAARFAGVCDRFAETHGGLDGHVHNEVQLQEAAASPRALKGRQRVAQGKREAGAYRVPLAPPWVTSSEQFSPLPRIAQRRAIRGQRPGEGVARCQLASLTFRWSPNVSRQEP